MSPIAIEAENPVSFKTAISALHSEKHVPPVFQRKWSSSTSGANRRRESESLRAAFSILVTFS